MITLRELATHLQASRDRVPEVIAGVVVRVTETATQRAKSYFGEYQSAAGVIPAWEPLAAGTLYGFRHWRGQWIDGKIDLGYAPPDNPLLRTGETRDSISGTPSGNTGIIGSPEKKMLWQEMGTPHADYPIPARPVLARAIVESIPDMQRECGMAAISLLVPEGVAR